MSDPIQEAIEELQEAPLTYHVQKALDILRTMQNSPAIAMSACTGINASLNEQAEPVDALERGDLQETNVEEIERLRMRV